MTNAVEKVIDDVIKHGDRAHAEKSPSQWERLTNCPGSILMCEGEPDKWSYPAALGEYGHEIGEAIMRDPKRKQAIVDKMTSSRYLPDFIKPYDVDGLRVHPKSYAEYNLKLIDRLKPYRVVIEEKMYLNEDEYGTCDFGMLYHRPDGTDGLVQTDYKNGSGYSVSATGDPDSVNHEANPQLVKYGLMLAQTVGVEPSLSTLVIYQPRVFGEEAVRKIQLTWPQMRKLRAKYKKQAKILDKVKAQEAEPTLKAGNWCAFCKAKYRCDVYREKYDTAGVLTVTNKYPVLRPHTLSDDQIVTLMRNERKIKSMYRAMTDYAIRRAAEGNPIPGTKPVQHRSNRRWKGTIDKITKYLKSVGVEKPVEIVEKLRGIVSVQSEIADSLDREKFSTGKARNEEAFKLLAKVVEKPEGELTIALEEDSRPAVKVEAGRVQTASDLLDDLPDEPEDVSDDDLPAAVDLIDDL